jgi:hypothetical protein
LIAAAESSCAHAVRACADQVLCGSADRMGTKMVVEVPAVMAKLGEAMAALVKIVEAQVARGAASGPSAYDEFEQALTESVAAIERAAHEPALAALDIDAPAITVDGRTYRRVLRSPGDYHARAGSVSVMRTLYRAAGDREAPSIDVVSLRAGVIADGWLPGTARQMAHLLQQGTSREAEATAGQLQVLPYSRSSFERVGHAVGKRYVERAAVIDRALIDDEDVPDEARSISVSIDRVSVPMEEPRPRPAGRPRKGAPKNPITRAFRMGYVGTVCLHDAEGRAIRILRYGTMPGGDPERLCVGLADDVLQLLAKQPRLRLSLLCDGAPEMWNLLAAQFDTATFGRRRIYALVDFWHTVEKLAAAAKVVDAASAQALLARWKLHLLNASSARGDILCELVESGAEYVQIGEKQPVHEAITYLTNNEGRMDYARARKLGLPIGSGNVEATCKSLFNMRMNRSGARWKIDTGEHIIQLRALALSDRWDAAMALTLTPPKPRIRRVA